MQTATGYKRPQHVQDVNTLLAQGAVKLEDRLYYACTLAPDGAPMTPPGSIGPRRALTLLRHFEDADYHARRFGFDLNGEGYDYHTLLARLLDGELITHRYGGCIDLLIAIPKEGAK